jgi:hypothetical protein
MEEVFIQWSTWICILVGLFFSMLYAISVYESTDAEKVEVPVHPELCVRHTKNPMLCECKRTARVFSPYQVATLFAHSMFFTLVALVVMVYYGRFVGKLVFAATH